MLTELSLVLPSPQKDAYVFLCERFVNSCNIHHYLKWNYSINLCVLSKHCLHNIYLPYIAKNDQWYEQGKQWYTEIRRQGFHSTYFAGGRTCNFLSHLKWKQFRIHIVLMCSLKKSVKLFTLEATFLKYVNLNLSF